MVPFCTIVGFRFGASRNVSQDRDKIFIVRENTKQLISITVRYHCGSLYCIVPARKNNSRVEFVPFFETRKLHQRSCFIAKYAL